jgi:hypothetical protein
MPSDGTQSTDHHLKDASHWLQGSWREERRGGKRRRERESEREKGREEKGRGEEMREEREKRESRKYPTVVGRS